MGSILSEYDQFNGYIERILKHEGGYVNHPTDPGGETKYGISKRTYPTVDIRNLSRESAKQIYYRDFWLPLQAWELPNEFAFQALDAAVNHGHDNALRWIQRAVGVADDGRVGPTTLSGIRNTSPEDLVLGFNAERLEFYTKLSTFNTFGRGWVRRIADNLRHARSDN